MEITNKSTSISFDHSTDKFVYTGTVTMRDAESNLYYEIFINGRENKEVSDDEESHYYIGITYRGDGNSVNELSISNVKNKTQFNNVASDVFAMINMITTELKAD